jgi:hypothetical protein
MARQTQPTPKRKGRDWGFLAFLAGVLLIALVILRVLVGMLNQMYF